MKIQTGSKAKQLDSNDGKNIMKELGAVGLGILAAAAFSFLGHVSQAFDGTTYAPIVTGVVAWATNTGRIWLRDNRIEVPFLEQSQKT